jgi:hypothetical protein
MKKHIKIDDIENLKVSSPEMKKKMLDSMAEKRSYSYIVKENTKHKMRDILHYREEKKKGMAIKEPDDIPPITYEGKNGWHTLGRAITTRTTDEAKGWHKELNNYKHGLTHK